MLHWSKYQRVFWTFTPGVSDSKVVLVFSLFTLHINSIPLFIAEEIFIADLPFYFLVNEQNEQNEHGWLNRYLTTSHIRSCLVMFGWFTMRFYFCNLLTTKLDQKLKLKMNTLNFLLHYNKVNIVIGGIKKRPRVK